VAYLCWCGVELTADDLEDMEAELPDTCGGTGSLRCMCGGDSCVCHNHGTVDCDGCVDCWDDDDHWPSEPEGP
jgi:hypothetical protein